MAQRTCAACGVSIEHKRSDALTCSRPCGVKYQNSKGYKRPARHCGGCGKDLTNEHGQIKYCSTACRKWVDAGHAELRLSVLNCAHCGKAFPRKGAQKYCSKKCNQAAVDKRRASRDAERYKTERERRLAYAIQYGKDKPHVGHAARTKRKQRIKEAGGAGVSSRDWLKLCLRNGGRCYYCGQVKPLTMDHVVPLSRGGKHSIGNIIPACLPCNSSKRTNLLVELRARGWKGLPPLRR